MIFQPERADARQFFFSAWQKAQDKVPLAASENMAYQIMQAHPEYHSLLNQAERYKDQEWPAELGETNPFLHMSLHMAIDEQLSIDQPFGIRELYRLCCVKYASDATGHAAQHEMMDGLVEMIWQAQRTQTPMDIAIYLNAIRRKLDLPIVQTNPIEPL